MIRSVWGTGRCWTAADRRQRWMIKVVKLLTRGGRSGARARIGGGEDGSGGKVEQTLVHAAGTAGDATVEGALVEDVVEHFRLCPRAGD